MFCHHFRLTLWCWASSCAKWRQGHQPRGQTPVHPADSPEGSQQLPWRHRGRCSAWEAGLIAASLIHTRKLKLCYRKSWGKRWFWSNLSQWLTLVSRGVCFCSALAEASWSQEPSRGCLSLPHFPTWQGAALQGKESQGLPSTRSAGNIKLRDWCLERFGDKGKWDSRISTLALVNPHCKIYFNSHLPASWLPWAAAYGVFLLLLQMSSC